MATRVVTTASELGKKFCSSSPAACFSMSSHYFSPTLENAPYDVSVSKYTYIQVGGTCGPPGSSRRVWPK